MKKSGFTTVVILIVAVLTLLVGGYWYWQRGKTPATPAPTPTPILSPIPPTPAPTANPKPTDISTWKTYTDRNLGYSIKYPEDWVKEDMARHETKYSGTVGGQIFSNNVIGKGLLNCNTASVIVLDRLPSPSSQRWTNLGEFFSEIYALKPGGAYQITGWLGVSDLGVIEVRKISNVEVGSYQAVWLYKGNSQRPGRIGIFCPSIALYFLNDDGLLYTVSTTINESSNYYPIAKQILDSFRLLD